MSGDLDQLLVSLTMYTQRSFNIVKALPQVFPFTVVAWPTVLLHQQDSMGLMIRVAACRLFSTA